MCMGESVSVMSDASVRIRSTLHPSTCIHMHHESRQPRPSAHHSPQTGADGAMSQVRKHQGRSKAPPPARGASRTRWSLDSLPRVLALTRVACADMKPAHRAHGTCLGRYGPVCSSVQQPVLQQHLVFGSCQVHGCGQVPEYQALGITWQDPPGHVRAPAFMTPRQRHTPRVMHARCSAGEALDFHRPL